MTRRSLNRPVGWGWRRWLVVGGLAGAVAGGVCWWQCSPFRAAARAAQPAPGAPAAVAPPPAPLPPSDYSSRVVAYLHESVPVTREMLGEYLIARYGAEKVELL